MPSQAQRISSGKANYRGSALAKRNAALRHAAGLKLARRSSAGVERLVASGRVTSVLDYCEGADASTAQINQDREPHLLISDIYNAGEYIPLAIYDCRVNAVEKGTGKCWIDLHAGEALVDGDTLVYWK